MTAVFNSIPVADGAGAELAKIAAAVAEALSSYGAEVEYFPEYELKELDTMRVIVIPASVEYKKVSRGQYEELLKVHVGIFKRAREDSLENLLRITEKIGIGFLNRRLAGAVCVCAAFNPLYHMAHLRERGQFTSVIELTFKQVKSYQA